MSKASLAKRENWPSNVYTIVHGKPRLSKRGEGKSAQQVRRTIEHMSKVYGFANHYVLVTEKELKKVPPRPQRGAGCHRPILLSGGA